jgi:hypothetical protein
MKTKFLLPHKFKRIGIIILLSTIAMLVVEWLTGGLLFLQDVPIIAVVDTGMPLSFQAENDYFVRIQDDIRFELYSVFAIIGGIFLAFSKQRIEDEYISKIRLESLVWATYLHFILLILSILAVYGIGFLNVLFINVFSVLILFNIRFYFILLKTKHSRRDEK